MGVTTRSASSSPVKNAAAPSRQAIKIQDKPADQIRVLLLPANLTPEARIVTLRHPRDATRKRFLFCPTHGLCEFTQIAHPPSEPRSMLFSCDTTVEDVEPQSANELRRFSDGYITKDAELMMATRFDLFFLLLALLPSSMAGSTKPLFQPIDDLFETAIAEDQHLRYVISQGRSLVEGSLRKFCDTVEAGDDTMFRVSEEKTMATIHQKMARMAENGLPPSMEERFVTRALEAPMLSVKRETSSLSAKTDADAEMTDDTKTDSFDSQSSVPSTAPSVVVSEVTVASSVATSVVDTVSSDIIHLQRQKVALDFLAASYLPPSTAAYITDHLRGAKSAIDFAPLDEHLSHLAKLKAEAVASRSLGDFSRKRGLEEEELAEERAEKKRRQDEDEKRKKASQSRGVKDLAKVNVTGMKKMSDFFSKKPVAKAKA